MEVLGNTSEIDFIGNSSVSLSESDPDSDKIVKCLTATDIDRFGEPGDTV